MIKKKADLPISELMSIILVAVLIILVILFIFVRSNFLEYIRLLPGFETMPASEVNVTNTGVGSSFCQNAVAYVQDAGNKVYLSKDQGTAQLSDIHFTSDNNQGQVFFGKIIIGVISGGKISINSNFFDLNSQFYQQARINFLVGNTGVDSVQLLGEFAQINNAVYTSTSTSSGTLVCKSNADLANEGSLVKNLWNSDKIVNINLKDFNPQIKPSGFFSYVWSYVPFFGSSNTKVEVNLPSILNYKGNTFKSFSIAKVKNIIYVYGDNNPVMIIFSDGSIWFSQKYKDEILENADKQVVLNQDLGLNSYWWTVDNLDKKYWFGIGTIYLESNLKLSQSDYNSLQNLLK